MILVVLCVVWSDLANLIMYADTEPAIDAVGVKQPPHGDQHQVKVVHS